MRLWHAYVLSLRNWKPAVINCTNILTWTAVYCSYTLGHQGIVAYHRVPREKQQQRGGNNTRAESAV